MEPRIIFQSDDFLVVEKPAGMIVNKSDTAKNVVTLQDWIDEKFQISNVKDPTQNDYFIDGYNKYDEFVSRSGIVHRLDKETSGIILVAKNVETFINLQNQFKSGVVKKVYTALVHGKVIPEEGEIDVPIGRLPWNRMRFGMLPEPDGKPSKTLYKVLSYKKNSSKKDEILTYVEAYPQTGRTHQIRVHFQHLNHPIFGDELYAGRKAGKEDRKHIVRHFLHASRISLKDPKTGSPITYSSSLPEELIKFFESLTDA